MEPRNDSNMTRFWFSVWTVHKAQSSGQRAVRNEERTGLTTLPPPRAWLLRLLARAKLLSLLRSQPDCLCPLL
jgi:hypothetical protein